MVIKQPTTVFQWLKLYGLYQSAFPANEKKPFSMIRAMQKKGRSDVWYCEQDGKFAGLVITINGPDKILLDYLAVAKSRRGQGVGSQILKKMREEYHDFYRDNYSEWAAEHVEKMTEEYYG